MLASDEDVYIFNKNNLVNLIFVAAIENKITRIQEHSAETSNKAGSPFIIAKTAYLAY